MTLWRTRKGGSRVRRYLRRAVLAVGLLLGTYFVVLPLAQSYVITHTGRAFVPTPNLGTEYEDVAFTTSDGLRLVGWYIPSRNGAAVIAFPGRRGPQKSARLLARHGYGVLLFDRRGEGKSEGDPNLLGWEGTRDLEAAVRWLEARPDVEDDRIGGVGLSVGGEMMLQEAAETDGLQGDRGRGCGHPLRARGRPRRRRREGDLLVALRSHHGRRRRVHEQPAASLPERSQRGDHRAGALHPRDAGRGRRDPDREVLRGGAGPEGALGSPGGHTGAIDAAPEEYERRVVGFFDRTLLER